MSVANANSHEAPFSAAMLMSMAEQDIINSFGTLGEVTNIAVAHEVPTVDDGTSCTVCLGTLRQTMLPPCGHPLCHACMGQLLTAAPQGVGAKCPSCRTPVVRSMYRRCLALDKAVAALHPGSSTSGAVDDSDPTDYDSIEGLRAWKIAMDASRFAEMVRLMWAEIRKCVHNSTALIWQQPADDGGSASDVCGCGQMLHGGTNIQRWNAVRGVPMGHGPTAAAVAHDPAVDPKIIMEMLWNPVNQTQISEMARAASLTLQWFTCSGRRCVLISWPPM
jgi:Zinc finger, C3HC4 type (RING finger)